MPEKIMMRLNKEFKGGFWAVDPAAPDSDDYQPVQALYEITPYGLLLASLAACTAQIVHAFAKNHAIDLQEIELKLAYHHRAERAAESGDQEDRITEQILFKGKLSSQEREKLYAVSHHCPVEDVLEGGIIIKSELITE